MTYLTVPIAAKSLKEAASQIKTAAKAGAEMLELRADYLEDLSTSLLEKLMLQAKSANLPVIVTPRDIKQGGANEYPDKLRVDVLVSAIKPVLTLSISSLKISPGKIKRQSQKLYQKIPQAGLYFRLIILKQNSMISKNFIAKSKKLTRMQFQSWYIPPTISTIASMPSICCMK